MNFCWLFGHKRKPWSPGEMANIRFGDDAWLAVRWGCWALTQRAVCVRCRCFYMYAETYPSDSLVFQQNLALNLEIADLKEKLADKSKEQTK